MTSTLEQVVSYMSCYAIVKGESVCSALQRHKPDDVRACNIETQKQNAVLQVQPCSEQANSCRHKAGSGWTPRPQSEVRM